MFPIHQALQCVPGTAFVPGFSIVATVSLEVRPFRSGFERGSTEPDTKTASHPDLLIRLWWLLQVQTPCYGKRSRLL